MHIDLKDRWNNLTTKSRLRVMIGVLLLIIVVPIVGAIYYSVEYSSRIIIDFAPQSADVYINNRKVSKGTHNVKTGTYEVTVSKKGFETHKEKVSINRGEEKIIEVILIPNDVSTANWYQENTRDYSLAQDIGDRKADRDFKNMIENYPLIKDLPIKGLFSSYEVYYGVSPTNPKKYAIFIDYQTDEYRQAALNAIKEKGYKITDYEVFYTHKASSTGGINFYNLSSLLKRGLDSDAISIFQSSLDKYYQENPNKKPLSLTITSVEHSISENMSTDTYLVSMITDVNNTVSLEFIITDNNKRLTVILEKTVIYDGSTVASTPIH